MGLFSKKDKSSSNLTPDTGSYGRTSPAPSSTSSNPPSYSSGYGGGSNYGGGGNSYNREPSGYGSSGGYNKPEPSGYGGAPEPTSYGANVYGGGGGGGANTRTAAPNPYGGGGSAAPNPYGGNGNAATTSPYGGGGNAGAPKSYGGNGNAATTNPYGGGGSKAPNPYGEANPYGGGGSGPGGYNAGSGGYGANEGYNSKDPYSTGDSRQMTGEEEEEEDADALKQQIKFTKQESVSSTRNALRAAARAEEVGRDTLTRLGEQGERLHQTEMNLELSKHHGHIAEDQAKQLKKANRGLFVPAAGNPFNRSSRAQQKEEEILERHRVEREERERIQRAGLQGQQMVHGGLRPMGAAGAGGRKKMSLAEKAKFQFEADEEDDQMEDEIDDNLQQLGQAAGRLKGLAQATGSVVDDQKKTIDRLNDRTQVVDDQIAKNSHKLKKFGF